MRTIILAVLAVMCLIVAGCGYEPAPVSPSPPAKQVTAQNPPAPSPARSGPEQSGLTGGMRAMGNAIGMAPLDMMGGPSSAGPAQPPKQPIAPPKPPVYYEKAQPGVGVQGRGYGGGLSTTPVATYFHARERIAFLRVEQALKEFKILQERVPRDQAEFDNLMKEYGVQLPRLNPDERYVYDPKTGQLFVEHPQ